MKRGMIRSYFQYVKRPGESCVFCEYAAGRKERELLYADEEVVVFRSRNPIAATHLLVCPKEHIATVHDLRSGHAELLMHMDKVGRQVLSKYHSGPAGRTVFGFHKPPFNSVDHLHLHCIGLPWANPLQPLRFKTGTPWFVPIKDLLETVLLSPSHRNGKG